MFDEIREALQTRYRVPLKGPGLNYYRDGRDSVAPHRDRELRPRRDSHRHRHARGPAAVPRQARPEALADISPASGDLLVMGGRCQVDWEHEGAQGGPGRHPHLVHLAMVLEEGAHTERSPSWRSSEVQRPDLG